MPFHKFTTMNTIFTTKNRSTLGSGPGNSDRFFPVVPDSCPRSSASLINPDPSLDLNGRRMSVVNLEAALASWKSIKNQKVLNFSQAYRSQVSEDLRITPARLGGFPRNLSSQLFSEE